MENFKIGETAKLLKTSASTLRRYEKDGTFVPDIRTPKNHRRYSKEQIDEYIKSLRK